MSGYGIELRVQALKKGERVQKKTARKAGDSFWAWFWNRVESYADKHGAFIGGLRDLLELTTDNPEWNSREKCLEFGISDGGGYSYSASLAVAHMAYHLVSKERKEIDAILKEHGFKCAQPPNGDEQLAKQRFFLFRGAIAQVFRLTEDEPIDDPSSKEGVLTVSADSPDGNEDPIEEEVDKLVAKEKRQVTSFWKSGKCECPVCQEQ